jgi:WhiB family redox-sensing transcriptional regulator
LNTNLDGIDKFIKTNRPSWYRNAACANLPLDLFFPERGQSRDREVKAICIRCPVRVKCLEFAVKNSIFFGYWGGISVKGRKNLAAELKEKKTLEHIDVYKKVPYEQIGRTKD